MPPEVPLSSATATPLAHALVLHAARTAGIRPVFLKGPGSVALGLRSATHRASDVDVLVSAEDVDAVCDALRQAGWRERPRDPDDTFWPRHSVTLFHARWPTDIDVHYAFPGCEADDVHAVLLEQAVDVGIGGNIRVPVPSRTDSAVLLALHALRALPPGGSSPQLRELERVLPLLVSTDELLSSAARLRATAALQPFVEAAYGVVDGEDWGSASEEWRRRIIAKAPGALRLAQLLDAPLRRRPALLWRAVFASSSTLRHHDLYARTAPWDMVVLNARRWVKGAKALPEAVRQLRRLRRRSSAVTAGPAAASGRAARPGEHVPEAATAAGRPQMVSSANMRSLIRGWPPPSARQRGDRVDRPTTR